MTTTATTRRAAPPRKVLERRRELCEQRLTIERRLAEPYAEIGRLDAELKKLATEAGTSFKEDFGALGYVAVQRSPLAA